MKNKFQLFLLSVLVFITEQVYTNSTQEKIEFAALQGVCTIKIMQEKLKAANDSNPIELRIKEIAPILKSLYDQCQTIINIQNDGLEQPSISTDAWINKSFREIYILQKDNTVRSCFNNTLNQLQELDTALTQDEKNNIFASFAQNIQNCSYQHALNVSRPHLDAAIERWKSNQYDLECDTNIFKTLIKHSPDEKDDLAQDLSNAYESCKLQSTADFHEFIMQMKLKINKINKTNNVIDARNCLQDLIDFQTTYFNDQTTDEEKKDLKDNFSIRYVQCKNK